MSNVIQKLDNVKSAPNSIYDWDDIWCALAFWSKIDATYAGNILLSHISEQTDPCPIQDLDAVMAWLTTNELLPVLNAETTSIDWIREAVTLHSEMLQRSPESH